MRKVTMLRRALVMVLSCFCSCLYVVCNTIVTTQAATIRIDDIPLGKVISVNGKKFAKVRNDSSKGSQFVAMKKYVDPQTTMQGWTDCGALVTPTGTNFTQGPILTDARDGKSYEIRKFSDGKCWMVDNLKYGGVIDACANKTTFDGNGSAAPTNRFGVGTYGDCRNNPGYAGYLYNWQAAMQHTSAYYNTNYTGPTTNVQGICPTGWHVPSGNTTGEFAALNIANGGAGDSNSGATAIVGFWQAIGSWKGVFSGICNNSGGLVIQGSGGLYWSSTQFGTNNAHDLNFGSSYVYPASSYNKNFGLAIRCVKN